MMATEAHNIFQPFNCSLVIFFWSLFLLLIIPRFVVRRSDQFRENSLWSFIIVLFPFPSSESFRSCSWFSESSSFFLLSRKSAFNSWAISSGCRAWHWGATIRNRAVSCKRSRMGKKMRKLNDKIIIVHKVLEKSFKFSSAKKSQKKNCWK